MGIAPAGSGPRALRVGGRVAMAAMLMILLLGAVQDALGLGVPALDGLVAGLLDPAVFILVALVLVQLLRRRTTKPDGGRPSPGVSVFDLVPLAVAVLGVRLTVESAWPVLHAWTTSPPLSRPLSSPMHRLGMGGALLAAMLLLILAVPRFRRRLWEYASAGRLRSGLYFTVAVLVVVYAVLLWVGVVVAGPEQVSLRFPTLFSVTMTLVLAQAAIALGEEIFYRGILQGEVGYLLGRMGLRNPRDRRLLAIGAVSLLFGLEHVGPSMTRETFIATLLYACSMSLLFGFLFELTGNLAVCTLAHFFNNLTVLGLGPSVSLPGPVGAFGDGVYMAAFLVVTFSLLFLLGRDPSRSLAPIRPHRGFGRG